MDVKGAVFAVVVLFAAVYVFFFQNPLFMANTNTPPPNSNLSVTPYLPTYPSPPWATTGFAYACSGRGPGLIQITNSGHSNETVVTLSLTYQGVPYSLSGPSCSVGPGTTDVSITALGGPIPQKASPYSGFVVMSDGTRLLFSGVWA